MHFFPSRDVFVSIGGFTIQMYAVCILIGAFLGYNVVKLRFKQRKIDIDLSDYFVYCLTIGIIGARIWYCIFMWKELYASDPISVFKIYEGGLAIQGGLFTGLIYSYYFFKSKGISFIKAADCIMPCVLIAQCLGRWGNFFNQEAFGQVMSEAQFDALGLPAFIKEGMLINGNYYQPTFLYESVLNIIGFFVITLIIHRICKYDGVEFGGYFVWYGITRFYVEGFRSDSLMVAGFRTAQIISVLFVLAGLGLWFYAYKTKKPIIE